MIVHNCENLIQALARIVITDAMVEIRGYDRDWHCALQVHDDVAYLCPEDEAEECYDAVMVAMTRPPRWAPSRLGLAAEGGIARRYGDAK